MSDRRKFVTINVPPEVKSKLESLKIHRKEPLYEVILRLITSSKLQQPITSTNISQQQITTSDYEAKKLYEQKIEEAEESGLKAEFKPAMEEIEEAKEYVGLKEHDKKASEKQINCIKILCDKLKIPYPSNLEELPKSEASEIISNLKLRLQLKTPPREVKPLTEKDLQRLKIDLKEHCLFIETDEEYVFKPRAFLSPRIIQEIDIKLKRYGFDYDGEQWVLKKAKA